MIMDRIKLQKEFRQMVKDFDGEKAQNNLAGSVCEHYAIEFAIQQVKNCSIPDVSQQRELLIAYELSNIEHPNIRDKEVAKQKVEKYISNL